MIIINNKEYNDYNVEISWGEFSISHYGKRRKGIALLLLLISIIINL